ncbi:MAG TPA: four helix bundle protein [Polyangiaceae bacterium]
MTNPITTPRSLLPHHKLIAYQVAVELLLAVKAANIRDPKLLDQAARAAKSACLNCAEGAGRVTRADKARVVAIARGEAVEAVAAVEIAALCGEAASPTLPASLRDAELGASDAAARCIPIADRLVALLTGFIR